MTSGASESPNRDQTDSALAKDKPTTPGQILLLGDLQKLAHIFYRVSCAARIGCKNGVTLSVE
jgi:hypothetical protein